MSIQLVDHPLKNRKNIELHLLYDFNTQFYLKEIKQ